MQTIHVKLKKIGNKLGAIIPSATAQQKNLQEGSDVTLVLLSHNTMTVHDVLKLAKKHPLPRLNEPLDKALKDIDKELWG